MRIARVLLLVGTVSLPGVSCRGPERATPGLTPARVVALDAEIRARTRAFSAAVLRASAAGWAATEVSALADFYDEATVVFPPRGEPLRGRPALQQYWTRPAERRIVAHEAVAERIDVADRLATEHGRLRITVQVGTAPAVRDSATYISYWRRSADGRWRKQLDSWW